MTRTHSNRTSPERFRQSSAPAATRLLLAALAAGVAGGCRTPQLEELERDGIEVRLDSNSKAHLPGRKIKFFVDLVNRTGSRVDITGVKIELRASPRASPETVSLRHTWRYRWDIASPPLLPGKRMTIPVVPEQGVEFPLEILSAGDYEIVAVVNELFTSRPYPLVIARPDLDAADLEAANLREAGGDSTVPSTHRTFEGESPLAGRGSGDRRVFPADRKEGDRP